MAGTTNWSWLNIARNYDETYEGNLWITRKNWSLTRKRISNAAYSSEEGTSQNSLSGYNAGVTETATCPYVNVVTFNANTNWTTTTTKWVETYYSRSGFPIYSKYNSNLDPILSFNSFLVLLAYSSAELAAGTDGRWGVAAVSAATTPPYWLVSAYNIKESSSSTLGTVDGAVLDDPDSSLPANGEYIGSATASLSTTAQLGFTCTGENQHYNLQAVDWYTQIQTWTYVSPWKIGT